MSTKICENQKSKSAEIKEEREIHLTISLDEIKVEPKQAKQDTPEEKISVLSKVRACQVVLNDIKHQFDEIALNQHKISVKEKNECKYCGKKIVYSKMMEHIKTVHPTELNLFYCKLCDSKFFKNSGLEIHMKRKHPNGKVDQFECDFDGKVFETKKKLTGHIRTHFSLVKCKICDKMMKHDGMYLHMKEFHAIDRKFQCKICSKSYKSKHSLAYHQKIHNKEAKCDICKKMFTTNSQLNRHKKEIHKNPKSFECEICNKKFNRKNHLEIHQKTHDRNRPKPYKCQKCDYTTDLKQYFKVHQKFHEHQEKKFASMKNPLKCEKCPTFHRSQKFLKCHMRSVHPKVLFQCDLCGNIFKTKAHLVTHINNHIRKLNT